MVRSCNVDYTPRSSDHSSPCSECNRPRYTRALSIEEQISIAIGCKSCMIRADARLRKANSRRKQGMLIDELLRLGSICIDDVIIAIP